MNANSKPKAPSSNITTVRDWLKAATCILKDVAVPSARLDAELLLADALEVDRTWLLAHADDTIPVSTAQTALERRQRREPLAYIRGWKEFYGRSFAVSPDVLIPRPESEALIDFIKELPSTVKKGHLIDIGTGSGCLGITAALTFPELKVTLSDTSDAALTTAQKNLSKYPKAQPRVTVAQSDLLTDIEQQPDIIIANLPYVDKSWQRSPETTYEPSVALFANSDGLALIYQLIEQASAQLTGGGYLLLEADTRQMEAIKKYAASYGFTVLRQQGFALLLQKSI